MLFLRGRVALRHCLSSGALARKPGVAFGLVALRGSEEGVICSRGSGNSDLHPAGAASHMLIAALEVSIISPEIQGPTASRSRSSVLSVVLCSGECHAHFYVEINHQEPFLRSALDRSSSYFPENAVAFVFTSFPCSDKLTGTLERPEAGNQSTIRASN